MKVVSAYRLSWRALAGLVLVGLVTANCTDTAGPETASLGQFSIVPMFESAAAGIIAINQVGIILKRSDSITVALDTAITLEPGQDSVDLTVTVIVLSEREQFFLEINISDVAGDTVFRGGPLRVLASTAGGAEPVAVPLTYTGVGADAAAVRVTTMNATTFFRDSVLFVAEALDTAGAVIPGTPVRWHTTDESIAAFPDHRSGWAHGGLVRGSVPVVAELLTGPTDTSSVLVQPLPAAIKVSAGDGQTAPAGGTLSSPIEVEVTADDLLGVEAVLVVFEADDPNGTLSVDSVLTDPFGKARAVWTLGPATGNLTARAVVPAIADTAHISAISTVTAVNWINPAGGNWSNPANWSPAIVPDFGNQAVIDLDGTYTVVLDVPTHLSVLSLGAPTGTQTLSVNGNTLTLDGPSAVGANGVLDFSGGTLDGLGVLSVAGNMSWSGGTMNGAGAVRVAAAGLLSLGGGTKTMLGGRTIDNLGNVTWLAGDIDAGEGSMLVNNLGATFGIQGDVQLLQGPGAVSAFFNSGTVTRSTGTGTAGIHVPFDNNGAVNVLTGTFDLTAGGFGTGSFDVSAGATLHFGGGNHDFGPVVNNGTIDVSAGIAKLTGTFTHGAAATLSGLGEFKVDGDIITAGAISMPSGELAVSGVLNPTGTFNAGTVTFFGPAQTIPVGLPYQNIQVAGTATVSGPLTIGGFVVVFGLGDLTIGTSSSLGTTGDVIVNDDATLRVGGGGMLTVGNNLRAQNNALVSMESGMITVANAFATLDSARLAMGTGDQLDVAGNVDFGGGSTAGMLLDGVIYVGGDFNQYGGPESFDASGGVHTVIFDGVNPQRLSFLDFVQSRFQNVMGAGLADIVLLTEVEIRGDLAVTSPGSIIGGMELNVRGNVDVGTGATLDLLELEIDGVLSVSGVAVYNVVETDFHGVGAQNIPTDLPYYDITVSGDAAFALGGTGSVINDLRVVDAGVLTVNQANITVGDDLRISDSAVVVMNDVNDVLIVVDSVHFGGGSTDAFLTAGTLYVGGNFHQGALTDPESFHAGGTHTVVFNGTSPQEIWFETPGIGIGVPLSHFANVAFENMSAGGIRLLSDVYGHSNLISGTGISTVYGNGYMLKMGGLDVQDLVFDRVLFEWNGDPNFPSLGSFVQFNNVKFQNYAATDGQFTIFHPGLSTSFDLAGLTFTTIPTLPGYYIRAEDSDGISPDVLTISVSSSSPATSGGLAVSAGGAVIAW